MIDLCKLAYVDCIQNSSLLAKKLGEQEKTWKPPISNTNLPLTQEPKRVQVEPVRKMAHAKMNNIRLHSDHFIVGEEIGRTGKDVEDADSKEQSFADSGTERSGRRTS